MYIVHISFSCDSTTGSGHLLATYGMVMCAHIQGNPMKMLKCNNEQTRIQQFSTRKNTFCTCSLPNAQDFGCETQAHGNKRTKRATCARNAR